MSRKFSRRTIEQAFSEWERSDKTYRLGQFFVNKYNLPCPNHGTHAGPCLFNVEDSREAKKLIWYHFSSG